MALNISIRSGQFGDDQLTSDHFSSTTQYASFLVDSSLTNGNAAVANIADLNALEATIETAIDSDLDARLGSLATVLGAGITYTDATDTFTFGTITLTSSASAAFTDWTSVIEAIDTALKTAETGISTNVTDIATNTSDIASLQTELNTTQTGAGLGTDGTYTADPNANYISSASSLHDADSILDGQIKTNADGIAANLASIGTNATNITNLDLRLTTAEGDISTNATNISGLQTELDATQTSLGFTNSTYTSGGTNHANTNNVTTDITALDTAITAVESAVSGLGDAFNYVNATSIDPQNVATSASSDPNATLASRTSWVAGNQFQDLSLLTEKDTGDYYKVATSGWVSYDGTGANTVWVNQYDGVVWNSTSSVDKIDNTNSEVQVTGNLTITGSADSGFNISSSVIDGKVATNEGDIASLQTFTGEGTALDTTATDLAAAINELHGDIVANDGDIAGLDTDLTALEGRVTTNEGDIATNVGNIGTNAGNIATNTSDIATNTSDIGDINTEMDAIETAVGLENDGTKTDFDSTGLSSTNFITKTGSFKDAIEELDAALEQSSTAPVDTGRLTVAPMSHQYAEYGRVASGGDLDSYGSNLTGADAGNGYAPATGGIGDLFDFGLTEQLVVLGSFISDAPNYTSPASTDNHLANKAYWWGVRVYKNGVRLFQRHPDAPLQASSDEYKVVKKLFPAVYPANYDANERYPLFIPSIIDSSYRLSQTVGLVMGDPDPQAGQPHPLAGMRNLDDAGQPYDLALQGNAHGNAGDVKYYEIQFGDQLDAQDIIVVDYMGLK